MTEVIFQCEGQAQLAREPGFRSVRRKEYYEGEYQILPDGEVSVRIEKGLDSAFSVISLRSSAPLKFRRNWRHIRQDKADVCVFWFVKRGQIVFTQSGVRRVIEADQCMISRSLKPFQMHCLVDADHRHEVLHVIVPTHLVRGAIPDHVHSGATVSTAAGDARLALRIFELLYAEGGGVSRKAADALAREAVAAIGSVWTQGAGSGPCSAGDRRFEAVTEYIRQHLSNPDLSAQTAARGAGISTGYLFQLLKARGVSFSQLLWRSRLACAEAWLADEALRPAPIRDIAYKAGFKSPAHFSRVFKRATGTTPTDFRARALTA